METVTEEVLVLPAPEPLWWLHGAKAGLDWSGEAPAQL